MIHFTNLKTWRCKQADGSWIPVNMCQLEEGDVVRIYHDGALQKGPNGETEFLVHTRPALTGDWVKA